jgi:phosphoglycolate phosphatase-like HAD superfamily hydrolase
VHFRRSADAAEALRRLQAAGVVVGAFTESPEPLARVALAQLGATRRIAAFEAGPDALPRLLEKLGADALVVRTRAELAGLG